MANRILVTGATGFLGSQIILKLLKNHDLSIIALIRAQNKTAAIQRAHRAWWDFPELTAEIDRRIYIIAGDVSQSKFGLDEPDYQALIERTDYIIHAAADLHLNAPINELRNTNVQGTANILALAQKIHQDHGLKLLAHISTAYVCGCRSGQISETLLSDEVGFSNGYELTKFEAEKLVREAQANLPISIFRPGMVVGDSRTGYIKTFNTIYFPLRLYLQNKLMVIPASPTLKINLIPVDFVASSIVQLTFEEKAKGLTFHLTTPTKAQPTIREFIEFVQKWAFEHLNLKLPKPYYIPLPDFSKPYSPKKNHSTGNKSDWKTVFSFFPYFQNKPEFLQNNLEEFIDVNQSNWQDFLPKILEFAVYHGFLHRSERTVHEQILFRLKSKRWPVHYYDIIDGEKIKRSTPQIREEMLQAAASLKALGIQSGDRIALVGCNSSRYLTLDVAIGLIGAISVPLYYTSPPAEINSILTASNAKLLFIGSTRIMDRISELSISIPIISFCRQQNKTEHTDKVINWENFLDSGNDHQKIAFSDVFPNEIATLRYSSGTTGQPKGVIFKQHHLRWMAESLASLPPWKNRHQRITYLSFLPLNHVVEGILAMYSPYYAPAPIEIYFLEDFRGLQKALPKVRPTFFFAVPRVYEKIREALQNSNLGRKYLRMKNGLIKNGLRQLLRISLLKRTGLNRCVQLIVGSAPVSEEMLLAFRDLGIEIHNAYGLTEAPLITINRVGDNHPDTVGQPLPETQIKINHDDEVLVQGPQVTSGYFDAGIESPIKEGWLATGDLGQLSANGRLIIYGRKKELIVTSYAKKIHPSGIENRLREIPGIVEAMLAGNNRPYCAAIMWISERKCDMQFAQRIDQAIHLINQQLSNAEQIKKWAILTNNLSIEAGDLTANLKLKREAITARLHKILACLYDETPMSPEILHLGAAPKMKNKQC